MFAMDCSILEDDLVRLRRCEPQDAEAFYRWESMPSIAASNTLCEPISLFQAEQLVSLGSSSLQQNGYLYLVLERKETVSAERCSLGYVMLYNYDSVNARSAIGVAIDERYRRCGFARRGIRLMCHYAFSVLRIERLIAEIAAYNAPSQALFESESFTRIATLPQWIRHKNVYTDLHIYALCPSPSSNK